MRKSIYNVDQIDALLSGKGMAIQGRYDSTDEITDPVEGGHYYIGTEEPYDVYTYVNGAWVNAGPLAIEGPPGPAFTYDDFTPEQLAALRGKDGKSPYINASTNNWMVWDEEKGSFVDTGVNAGGKAPSIGANGNWFIDGVDTGVPATNAQLVEEARKYAEAAAASAANAGNPPYIGDNGNWFVWDGEEAAFVDSGTRAKGDKPVAGTDYWTEADKEEIAEEASKLVDVPKVVQETGDSESAVMSQKAVTDKFNGYVIPDYWQAYLDGKIADIKALQDAAGKDCFSFVVMTDLHYPSNLGKCSPDLARYILNNCDIKFALCLGDVQTRGCHATKELLLAENVKIEEMLKPIRDRLLQTQGNHDGNYGWLDRDGNGEYNNSDSSGNLKPEEERETYVYSLTPSEMYSAIYRKVGLVGDCHFDSSGTGYWIDDVSNKVRYIILNTHNTKYELQEDGTAKYPPMWVFRFQQSQFDLTIEALNSVPADDWAVVVAGHCPLWQEIGDRQVMKGVLAAYKAKDTYSGEYAGTAEGEAAYTNLADPTDENWKDGYRLGSSTLSPQTGKTTTNLIECKTGDVVRVKGVDFAEGVDRVCFTVDATYSGGYAYVSDLPNSQFGYELVNGVHEFTILSTNATYKYFRCTFDTPTDPNSIIITVNEPIEKSAYGYDYVSVDCDFSEAKGKLVGYFAGHAHVDANNVQYGAVTDSKHGFQCIATRCDAAEESDETLKAERVEGTTTEQSFDVFTVNTKTKTIHATKIGAGSDRTISY